MNQTEAEELRKIISDRFDETDRKLETQINEIKIEIVKVESRLERKIGEAESKLNQKISETESKLNQKIGETESKLNQKIGEAESKLGQEIAGIKVDITWIKWLFGGLLSFILILLSILITVLFKLVG